MTRASPSSLFAASLAAALAGCVPDFADDGTRIDARRVVAITALPAEVDLRLVTASREVALEAAVADPNGGAAGDLIWTLCLDRKPLSELGPVSERCLASPVLEPEIGVELGRGPSVVATLPENACQLFGPERPDPKPGEPAGRPVDPDPTGGFYQPVLAWLDGRVVLGAVRITCGLFNVTPSISTDFTGRYRTNENPSIERLELVRSNGEIVPLSPDDAAESIRAGEAFNVRVAFPLCPDEPEACGGAETYVVYDSATERVEPRRESLVVSWYSTGGTFDSERTGEGRVVEESLTSENRYVAPAAAGPLSLWVVARDDRGGSAYLQANLDVTK